MDSYPNINLPMNEPGASELRRRVLFRNFDFETVRTILWPIGGRIGDHIIDFEVIRALKRELRIRNNRSEIVLELTPQKFKFFCRFLMACKIADDAYIPERGKSYRGNYPLTTETRGGLHSFCRAYFMELGSQWDTRWALLGAPGRFKAEEILPSEENRFWEALEKERSLFGAKNLSLNYILLSPDVATAAIKKWPVKHWSLLAQRIQREFGLQVVLLAKKSAESNEILSEGGNAVLYDYTSEKGSDFLRLLALIDGAQAVVATDSGVAHAAGLISKKCLTLWGPSSPLLWGHRNNINIRLSGCKACFDDMQRRLACTNPSACIKEISPDDVMGLLKINLPGLSQQNSSKEIEC